MSGMRRARSSSGGGQRLQRGQAGEIAAEYWFKQHGWKMVRTQPPVTIIGILTGPMIQLLSRFMPRLAHFGRMIIGRVGKPGAPDYTGYESVYFGVVNFYAGKMPEKPEDAEPGRKIASAATYVARYRACEVKEACGDSMPASRLDKEQRKFMDALPAGSAFVGVFWTDYGVCEMFLYIEKGSYKKGQGITDGKVQVR